MKRPPVLLFHSPAEWAEAVALRLIALEGDSELVERIYAAILPVVSELRQEIEG